jgi:hypothetical protein
MEQPGDTAAREKSPPLVTPNHNMLWSALADPQNVRMYTFWATSGCGKPKLGPLRASIVQ